MKDVALHAGVGLKTVSRVVNDEPGVTEATAARVRSAITALGFRRNDSARILRKRRTQSIGLVVEDIGDPFYAQLHRAVEEEAHARGHLLFAGSSSEEPERERELALAFCARRVDGLIVVPAGTDHRYLLPEITAGVATTFVDRPAGGIESDAVVTANTEGARLGVAHLVAGGHRRIGFVGDRSGIYTAERRLAGYRAAMAEAGLPVDERWICPGPIEPGRVAADVRRLLAGPDPVTALFSGNNRATVQVLRALGDQRDRIALVGFDDLEFAELLRPAVTVVAQDVAGLGRTAAQLLFRRLDGSAGPPRDVELPTRLIPRGSGELPPAAS
ncbi:LacI family DNA-binding transcriptional regulator [Allostreptomyces psammosilenae]|nr:LacI family DNA-binding transcriptional regulator [Allostreptomyces psammosilenae]